MNKFRTIFEASTKEQIEKIFDKHMRVDTGPRYDVGYAEWARTESGYTESVIQTKNGFELTVEYEAADKNDAKQIAKTLSKEISKLLGTNVKFTVVRDIWGIEDDADDQLWYVNVDTEVKLPL